MDSLESELAVSPPPPSPPPLRSPPLPSPPPPPRSPPLAFVPTSNDSLALPRLIPPSPTHAGDASLPAPSPPLDATMGLTGPWTSGHESDLQVIVDQQSSAMQLLHGAFAAERQVWSLERERLYQRIASLEHLLKAHDHHSPAKSPLMSPLTVSSITSPQSRAMASVSRLPIIAEDENLEPLSQRRGGAPHFIDMPGRPPVPALTKERADRARRGSSVSFDSDIKVDDVPISPPSTSKVLSPLPSANLVMAGHTPLRAHRASTPPPQNTLMDGSEDTPTRNNTHINAFLARSRDSEEDVALKGPLNLPELPNQPDEMNFTLEALSKRLEQIEQHPEEGRPMIFSQPSPGLASPAEYETESSKHTANKSGEHSSSDRGSNTFAFSSTASQDAKDHFDGGIKLRRKPSTNFGAPFGQLGGFGRKMS